MLKADGLKGAVVYYDAQQNDSRMNVLLVLTGELVPFPHLPTVYPSIPTQPYSRNRDVPNML